MTVDATGSRRGRRDERGSALVIAFVFAIVFSLFVAEVVGFADVGLKSTKAVSEQRHLLYAADAAVEAAIARYQVDPAACSGPSPAVAQGGGADTDVDGVSVDVDCLATPPTVTLTARDVHGPLLRATVSFNASGDPTVDSWSVLR